MNQEILNDMYRFSGSNDKKMLKSLLKYNDGFRFMFFWRKAKSSKGIMQKFYKRILEKIKRRTAIEIPLSVQIGDGIQMIHPYGITINSKAKLGKNCVLLKGCTIGNQKRGKNMGAPTIGNDFYLGLNSSVVGGITIGDDVLIAPNTYVNFDVPSHSIVIGSPGVIHSKINATENYINNKI